MIGYRDLKPTVYCAAVAHGDQDVFDFLHGQYKQTEKNTFTKDRFILLNSLACTRNVDLQALYDYYTNPLS